MPPSLQAAGTGAACEAQERSGFEVRLLNFTGPFDVLLGLISKQKLDVTEIALATVTDEFIAYTRGLTESGAARALDETSEFLVIAATLLDLKAARLLPAGSVEEDEDVALLEARDLLFARLLQYRAFKHMAGLMGDRLAEEAQRFPRQVSLEPQFAAMLPELVWRTSPEQFAALARRALTPREQKPSEVGLAHLHAPKVSVGEQAGVLTSRLAGAGELTFAQLVSDAGGAVVVARFLALLELFRDGAISFTQAAPLAELRVTWHGPAPAEGELPISPRTSHE